MLSADLLLVLFQVFLTSALLLADCSLSSEFVFLSCYKSAYLFFLKLSFWVMKRVRFLLLWICFISVYSMRGVIFVFFIVILLSFWLISREKRECAVLAIFGIEFACGLACGCYRVRVRLVKFNFRDYRLCRFSF